MKKRISKNMVHFLILIIKWKTKNKNKVFLNLFWFKTNFKKPNQNFRIHFSIWNQKMNFKKFFHFSILVMKLKNGKWKFFKIRFLFKLKNELYFRYTDSLLIFQFWLLNEKRKTKTKFFLDLFWFKTNFKKPKSKFWYSFFHLKSKIDFQKIISFFNFSCENEKWKTKNFQNSFCF